MNGQIPRMITLGLLIFGCLALAVPQVSQRFEAWLMNAPVASNTPSVPTPMQPVESRPIPSREQDRATMADYSPSPPLRETPSRRNFVFGYDEEPRSKQSFRSEDSSRHYPVQPSSLEEPASNNSPDLSIWQRDLEQLGAKYVVVEKQGERIQCRCLMPLSPGSVYEKAFAAEAAEPVAAMQAVIEQVRRWQATSGSEPVLRSSR